MDLLKFISMAAVLLAIGSCSASRERREAGEAACADAIRFIAEHDAMVRPLEVNVAKAWWTANTTGKDEDFKAKEEAQNRLNAALADRDRFAELRTVREELAAAPLAPGGILSRQIEVLYLQYLEKQVDPALLKKITARENAVEKAFNVYRAEVAGKQLTDSEVRKVLKESKDQAQRKAVWEASKAVGPIVEPDLRELVALRNEAARTLGFENYHVMALRLAEQDQTRVIALFDELDDLVREPFRALKAEIDAHLAKRYGIAEADLRPWHYLDPFFQEPQAIFEADFDPVYATADIQKLCREFYAGIGLPVEAVLARSDLFEKPGKSPHAFCTDIDRQGDVRVLANIVPNEYWMGTMLHELGHAVYSSINMPPTLPYVVRTDAHPLCTEGIATMFERFSKSVDWLQAMGIEVPDREKLATAGAALRRAQLLIFAAWCQVMLRFEKGMYENPGQDLSKLWWDLAERYQLLRRPEGRAVPDYASKIHIVSAPAYYHNYLMGQLFACQVHAAIASEVLKVPPAGAIYNGNPAVGSFLRDRIFSRGRSLDWNQLALAATGADLGARAFAAELIPPE